MNYLFDYGSVLNYTEDQKNISHLSICYTPKMPLKTSMLKTTILEKENYRPDKVSYRLFGDPNLSWVLDEINSFYLFSDYYLGREIYYLTETGLKSIGIETEYISYEMQNY
jgi:hypothetical protein